MSALKPNTVSKFIGNLLVRYTGTSTPKVDLGAVRALVATLDTTDGVTVNSDNLGEIFAGVKQKGSITVEMLENNDVEKFAMFFSGTSSITSGTPVTGATKVIASGFSYNTVYEIEKGATITSVVGSVDGAFVGGTDYDVVEVNGVTAIALRGPNTTAQNVTVTYDYTPAVSKNFTYDVGNKEVKYFEVTIESFDELGRKRTFTLLKSKLSTTYDLSYVDLVEAGDTTGATLTFEAVKGSTIDTTDEIL